MTRGVVLLYRLAFCALLALCGLVGCGRGEDLAKLQALNGKVERDVAKQQGTWSAAAVGATFVIGDAVRTAAAAKAELALSDGSDLTLQEKTLLRFLASPPGKKAPALAVEAGEVEVDVGASGLEIETLAGPTTLDPGTRVRLRKTDQGTRFSVEIGAAHLTDLHRDLKAGEELEIGIGRAVIERVATPAPSASSAPASLSAAPGSSVSAPAVATDDARPRGPVVVDLFVAPGDSLVVHDPHPPTAVGFATTRCAGVAVLELGTKKRETVGSGNVSASVPAGSQRYRLRCDTDGAPFAEGTLTVLADAGRRRLASSAPANRIDVDGRRYTILYQGLLPKVSVRWPNPPSAGPFTLFVRSQGKGQKQLGAPGPSYALPAGTLGEGTHELWFGSASEQSRKTTVVVQFDNAAPTASISSPAERGFAPGATVTAAGTALPGWSVTVAGHELAQDAQQRFSGEVTTPAGATALAIRFAHPQRGVHYYLRRPSH